VWSSTSLFRLLHLQQVRIEIPEWAAATVDADHLDERDGAGGRESYYKLPPERAESCAIFGLITAGGALDFFSEQDGIAAGYIWHQSYFSGAPVDIRRSA